MDINAKDLGKIVELPAKQEWGPGIIGKTDFRFAYVIFQNAEEGPAKKFYLTENLLKWAAQQDEPTLVKKARIKNRKIKPKVIVHQNL